MTVENPRQRRGIGAAAASVWLLVVWTIAAQTAVLLAALISFAEVNGVAAVVLFAGFGLAVTVLLAVFHGVARRAEQRRAN